MTEQSSEGSGLDRLGDTIANIAITTQRHREFLARKAARVFMEETGLLLKNDDTGNTALEEVLGIGIASGMILAICCKTTPEDIDKQTNRLLGQTSDPLQEIVGTLTPRAIQRGIEFYTNEVAVGSNRVTTWTQEFKQLQTLDPQHQLWRE